MRENIITKSETNCNIDFIVGTGEVLEDYSGTCRKRPWHEKKKENLDVYELLGIEREKDDAFISVNQLQNIKNCGTYLKFGIRADYTKKLAGANFCKFRLCPMCAWRRSLKLFSQVSSITEKILSEKEVRFLFLTLTVKNVSGGELRETIKAMNAGFRKLVQNKKGYKASRDFRKNLLGYLKAIEVTYNQERDDFHPHIHTIIEVSPEYFEKNNYLSHEDWVKMWREVMQLDYDAQLDIRTIKNTTSKAIAEVAKYPIKLSSLLNVKDKKRAANALKELRNGIANLRFIEFGGDFRLYRDKLKLDDIEDGNLIHVETDDVAVNYIAYQIFRYNFKSGFYVC